MIFDIKLIVFDVDGTFYDLNDVAKTNYEMERDFLSEQLSIPKGLAESMLEKADIFSYKSSKSKSATEFFARQGLSSKKWTDYRERHFDVRKINLANAVKPEVIKKICDFCPSVVLTSNTSVIVSSILQRLGISKKWFIDIVTSDRYSVTSPFSKRNCLKMLSSRRSVNIYQMLSIGDRYDSDIRPILEMGGKAILISKPSDFEDISELITSTSTFSQTDSSISFTMFGF